MDTTDHDKLIRLEYQLSSLVRWRARVDIQLANIEKIISEMSTAELVTKAVTDALNVHAKALKDRTKGRWTSREKVAGILIAVATIASNHIH
jgi:hypothetical protein